MAGPAGPGGAHAAPRFVSAGRMRVHPAWSAARHEHDLHELMVIHGGRLRIDIGAQSYDVGPGDVVVYAPHTPHREWARGGDGADFSFMVFAAERWHAAPHTHDSDGRMQQLIEWILREQQEPQAPDGMIHSLLAVMLHAHDRSASRREKTLADQTREFLLKRLAATIEVEEMARAARMSRAHFMRRFKKETGRTPMQELRHLRLAKARELIASTALPLREVAARVGLGDEYQLSHVFRRELGVPPGYFRANP